MRIHYSTLLGLSIWLVLLGSAVLYGAYTGSLNESNANTVIGALILAADAIGLSLVIRYLLRAAKPRQTSMRHLLSSVLSTVMTPRMSRRA